MLCSVSTSEELLLACMYGMEEFCDCQPLLDTVSRWSFINYRAIARSILLLYAEVRQTVDCIYNIEG